MRRVLAAAALCVAAVVLAGAASAAELPNGLMKNCAAPKDHVRRVALILGNGKYQHLSADLQLETPAHDAAQMAQLLCKDGYEYVDYEVNRTKDQMEGDLRRLNTALTPATKLVLAYYSGHGVQNAGTNYLIPADVSLDRPNPYGGTVPMTDVIKALGDARADLARVVLLDACRDNGIKGDDVSLKTPQGAVNSQTDDNLFMAWANVSGAEASGEAVGKGRNSPYTWALLRVLDNSDLSDIERVHEATRLLTHDVTLKHFRKTSPDEGVIIEIPDASDLIVNPPFYYKPPAAADVDPRLIVPQLEKIDDDFWADNEVKSIASNAPVAGLALPDLLRKAQDALKLTAKKPDGTPATDTFDHTIYEPNFADAARYWQAAAEKGSVTAMRRLGQLYYTGHGVDRNYQTAMQWLEKAAAKGDLHAIDELGDAYRDGDNGKGQDQKKALQFYQRAMDSGLPAAKADVAYFYLWGYAGLKADPPRAFAMFKQAEAAGAPEASAWLGWIYWAGRGTERNIPAAIGEFQKAADEGDSRGIEYLSKFYEAGFGIKKDVPKSRELFSRAAALVNVWYIKKFALDKD